MMFLKDDKILGVVNVDKIVWEQGNDGSVTVDASLLICIILKKKKSLMVTWILNGIRLVNMMVMYIC
jgi:hypothetical protein